MRTSSTLSLMDHLRRSLLPEGAVPDDSQLLLRFIESHDETAFATLVKRHGAMVWGVCRRLLNTHDAEDAFQATFLVLAQKASSIRSRVVVGNWLYGVAHQTALQSLRAVSRRRSREIQVTTMPDVEAERPNPWSDLQPVLHEELSYLPNRYRSVIVLCDLEGRTRKEAARSLGVPEGTVAGRLARARAMLARRLTQRGLTLSAAALPAILTHQASASVPQALAASTIKAASLLAAGKAITGVISVKIAALAAEVMKTMMIKKLQSTLAFVVILGLLTTVAIPLGSRLFAGQEPSKPTAQKREQPTTKPEAPRETRKETPTAWGREVGGLQAGLGLPPDAKPSYEYGEAVRLIVRIRNVSKRTISFEYLREYLDEFSPTLTDVTGMTQRSKCTALGVHFPIKVTLEPGQETELESRFDRQYELRPKVTPGRPRTNAWPLHVSPGKIALQHEQVLGHSSAGFIQLDPVLTKLATGKLELEVKAPKTPGS